MGKEVQGIARASFSGTIVQHTTVTHAEPMVVEEIEVPRDELIFPVDPAAEIDIYAGLTLPVNWCATPLSYLSSNDSG